MQDILSRSTNPALPNGCEEWAFWGADAFGGGYDYDEPFTDHITNEVDVASRQPGYVLPWLSGHHKSAYYFHSYPNNRRTSPVDDRDRTVAGQTGSMAIEVDRGGRVT